MPRVTVKGVSLAVREWPGQGPAIVCIHGLTANHTCFSSIAESLSPEYRIIAYDLRCRGESDKPPQDYSLQIHCQDLQGLLDHYGLKKPLIMGHSGMLPIRWHIGVSPICWHLSTNHYTVLIGNNPKLKAPLLTCLRSR